MRLMNKEKQVIALRSGAVYGEVKNVGLSKLGGITGTAITKKGEFQVYYWKQCIWKPVDKKLYFK